MASMEDLNQMEADTRGWGIDKKVPVALIFVVIAQTLAFTWGAATLSNDVKNNGKAIAKLEVKLEKLDDKIDEFTDEFNSKLVEKYNKSDHVREKAAVIHRLEGLENRVLDVERGPVHNRWDKPSK